MKNTILHLSACILLIISNFSANGQGWLPNEDAYAATPLASVYGGGAKADNLLRVVNKIKAFSPTPSNQGQKPSCVSEAICNALTIKKALDFNLKKEDIDAMRFSPAYLYHQIENNDCSQGTIFEDILKITKEKGVCALNQFNRAQCNVKPDINHHQLAEKNKIRGFQKLFLATASADDKLYTVKAALSGNLPVVAGFHLDESFMKLQPGTMVWNPTKLDFSNPSKHSRHAMVIVGYDDDRNAFEIMNSWGAGWANKGFIWIPYDIFIQVCECAYILDPLPTDVPKNNENAMISLAGNFGLRTPKGFDWNKNKALFEKQLITHKGEGVFTPQNPDWKVNSVFQLTTSNEKSCFMYVISKNPNGKVNLNFPTKDERLVSASSGYGYAYNAVNVPLNDELQIIPHCQIILPDSTTAMKIIEAGEDQSCVLFSAKRIENLNEVITKLNTLSGTLQERVKTYFGNAIIPASEIKYEDGEEMKVNVNSKSGGYIAPIFLNITAK